MYGSGAFRRVFERKVQNISKKYDKNNMFDVGGLWAAADRFVKFFGVKSSTKNFRTFSQNVKRGSFITYDSEGDGKWNHMG